MTKSKKFNSLKKASDWIWFLAACGLRGNLRDCYNDYSIQYEVTWKE
jgi:hypothetical protein